ncbi:hypothetical protein DAPPUDRAFT_240023 [Daphnia pulex]|uniref:Uncharacterized protein n=1 Tax=Daphnia pulex TaxID=6669 RepID=E9GAP7_DAPPU|nr:hypothetical protein DAPPUDRAFT_240023 [Daphnia pulex]|eukprot:EFX83294.1 hypothetical protein DAPPUDRAFT_240023 [Daphnia pulex]
MSWSGEDVGPIPSNVNMQNYYTEVFKYYTTKAPKFYTTTYAAPSHYTDALNCYTEALADYSTKTVEYHTEAAKYYSAPAKGQRHQ